jgi:uncharacterized protein (TIGR02246 family)
VSNDSEGNAMSAEERERLVRDLYEAILEGWNGHSGESFAAPFAEDGEVVGFDGSQHQGRAAIAREMDRIFADHETGRYVGKVRSVRAVGSNGAVLRAVAGMVPAAKSDIDPRLNAVQTVVAERIDGEWRVVLYQNTPAQFHGRPDLVERLTDELREHARDRS